MGAEKCFVGACGSEYIPGDMANINSVFWRLKNKLHQNLKKNKKQNYRSEGSSLYLSPPSVDILYAVPTYSNIVGHISPSNCCADSQASQTYQFLHGVFDSIAPFLPIGFKSISQTIPALKSFLLLRSIIGSCSENIFPSRVLIADLAYTLLLLSHHGEH